MSLAIALNRCASSAGVAFSMATRAFSAAAAEAAAAPAVEAAVQPNSNSDSSSNSSASEVAPGRVKMKNTFKRASSVMAAISRESTARMAQKMMYFRPPMPAFNVGDAVELQYANEMNETNPVAIRGTVIGKTRKGPDSKFTILNSLDDEWYTATYPHASPLLRSVRVMMRNRHSEGQKAPRRAKLNYLLEADPRLYYVDQNTKEAAEKTAEKLERRALLKSGKAGKKAHLAPPGAAAGVGGKGAAAAKPGAAAAAKKK